MIEETIQIFDPIYNVNALREKDKKKATKANTKDYRYNYAVQKQLRDNPKCWNCCYFGKNCNAMSGKCKIEVDKQRIKNKRDANKEL